MCCVRSDTPRDDDDDAADEMLSARLRGATLGDTQPVLARVAQEPACILSSDIDPETLPEHILRKQRASDGLVRFRAEPRSRGGGNGSGKGRGGGKGNGSSGTSTIEFDPTNRKLIGSLIGPKGATVKQMQAASGARIEVRDGAVNIRARSPEQIKAAEDAVREILNPSYGIVAWCLIDDAWCMLMQLSYSTGKHDMKVDPLRGRWKHGESPWATACREVKEESADLLQFADPSLDAVLCRDRFHVRVRFESDDERRQFLEAYDENRRLIVQGALGADRAREANRPAEPVALVWLDPKRVTRLQLPLRRGDCSAAILSRADMAAMLHEQRRAQLKVYPEDWLGEGKKPGMAQTLAKQILGLLKNGQIDLPLLSSTCRLQLEFGMDAAAAGCTVPEALLGLIDEVLARSTRLLGSCALNIDDVPIQELHAAAMQICQSFHLSIDVGSPVIDAARRVLSFLGEKAAARAACTIVTEPDVAPTLSPDDKASSSSTPPCEPAAASEVGLEFAGVNACNITGTNMPCLVAVQSGRLNVGEHDEPGNEAKPASAEAA